MSRRGQQSISKVLHGAVDQRKCLQSIPGDMHFRITTHDQPCKIFEVKLKYSKIIYFFTFSFRSFEP